MRKEKKESGRPRKESGRGKKRVSEDEIVLIDDGSGNGNGKRKTDDDEKEEVVTPTEEEAINDGDEDEESWCFVCKDGGSLRICDYPKCNKWYHFGCMNKKINFLRSDIYWECPRHKCFRCQEVAMVACYCCPTASCSNYLCAPEIVRIGDENGFCQKCMKFVLYFEKETKRKPNDDSISYEDFSEYYVAVKKRYGFTLDNIRLAYKGLKSGEKRKSSSVFQAATSERPKKTKKNSCKASLDEETPLIEDIILVPSLVPENVKLIYLTRSVFEKLLKHPESFEDKVKGTFFGIDFPRKGSKNRVDRQLLQVTGVSHTSSHDGQITIKLQAKNMPNDVSIDMVSDLDFGEILCRDLRQNAEVGLIEMPSVEELERKARVLSEDLVDDWIAREVKRLQRDIDMANERGLRPKFHRLSDDRRRLETPAERWRLIRAYPRVISEVRNKSSMSEGITNGMQGINDLIDAVTLHGNDKFPSGCEEVAGRPKSKDSMDGNKQNEGSPTSAGKNLELNKGQSSVSKDGNESQVVVVSHHVQEEGRVQVDKLVSRAPLSLTTMTRVNSHQLLQEIKHKEGSPEQNDHGKRTTIRQPVAPAAEETEMMQQLRHLIPSSGNDRHALSQIQQSNVQGCIMDGNGKKFGCTMENLVEAAGSLNVNGTDGEFIDVAEDSIKQSLTFESECNIPPSSFEVVEEQNRFDVMNEEFLMNTAESSKKILVVKDSLAEMDVEVQSREGMTKENPHTTAVELIRIEEKIDRIGQQIKQMEGKAQSAEGASLVPYNTKSDISIDDVIKSLEPVTTLACTKILEEIKAKHIPDLDVKQFPIYDPNVLERVNPLLRGAIESFINEGISHSQVKTEDEKSSEVKPLAVQHPEVTEKVNLPYQ